jgi:hypothetical protein
MAGAYVDHPIVDAFSDGLDTQSHVAKGSIPVIVVDHVTDKPIE